MSNDFIFNIAKEFISTDTTEVADIITFVEAPWGLNVKLLPVQAFMLKCFYGLPLNENEKTIQVPDIINDKILYEMTEKDFLKFLHSEGRCNTDIVEGKKFHELILVIGRRGTKCRAFEDRIPTTEGSLTFENLLAKCQTKNHGIGILTYDPETFKSKITYDFLVDYSGYVDCFKIKTQSGIKEISSGNHPYLIKRTSWDKPRFIELSEVIVGDKVAVSKNTKLFGKGGLGVLKAALLGCILGKDEITQTFNTTIEFIEKNINNLKDFSFSDIQVKKAIEWLKNIGSLGIHPSEKTLPVSIYNASREEIVVFISGVIEHSGNFLDKSLRIDLFSKKMIEGIKHILLKFGIKSLVKTTFIRYGDKLFDGWRLEINDENSLIILKNLLKNKEIKTTEEQTDIDWEDVVSVEYVGKRHTVDLEVADTHIIGGDLISHNSSLASFISNYELYRLIKMPDPNLHYSPARTPIYILNVAPTDDTAAIVFDMIQNMAIRCPYIKDRCLHKTMTYFDVQSDADIKTPGKPKASIVSVAGGCSSNALRGRNAIIVIMDEMAHFIDNAGRFSGTEVYKALTPSTASFGRDGKVITISSPYAKYGAFYDRYQQSFDETDITLMFKMYSAMVNPTIPTEILAAARRRDRVGFMCEFGGEFSDAITAWIDDEQEFRKCVYDVSFPVQGDPEETYYMGIDLGFKNDGTAISIVHQDKKTKQIILDYTNVWFSGSSDVWEYDNSIYKNCRKYVGNELLSMTDIVYEIKELCKLFPIKAGIFDQSNGYGLAELLRKENMKFIEMQHFTDQLNSDIYQILKMLYAEGLLYIPNHPVLIGELLSLESERKSRGNIESEVFRGKIDVKAPNRKGAHDDISESYARAVYLCYSQQKERVPFIATGAGGSIGMLGLSNSMRQESLQEFRIKRYKDHGEHPRGLDGFRRKTHLGSAMGMAGVMSRRARI